MITSIYKKKMNICQYLKKAGGCDTLKNGISILLTLGCKKGITGADADLFFIYAAVIVRGGETMADKYVAYVGSYTRGESKGLNIFDFDPDTLTFKLREVFEINNPSVVHVSHDQRYLYCNCDEGVASFKILKDGSIVLMNKASVNGLRPCYLATDRENHYLVTAGYHDGKLTVLRLEEDGSIGGVTDEVFMKGLGSVAGRNYRCHVNCALFTPDEKYLLAVDLGMDQVKIYEFDAATGKIKLHDILRCELESGPKHMIFSHDGKYAYLTHEDKNYVTKYAYTPEHAVFTKLQTISTLPDNMMV